jgi:hypothetical protein
MGKYSLRAGEAGGDSGAGGGGGPAGGGAAGALANGAGGGGAAGGAGGASGEAASWLAGVADADLRGFAESKGFDKPEVALDAYRNLEKVLGVPRERLLKLPEKADDPAWGEIYERLGKPKEAGHYSVPDALKADPVVGKMREAALAAHLTAAQWEAMQGSLMETATALTAERQAGWESKAAGEMQAVKTEWGAKYEENVEIGRRAARLAGWDADTLSALESALGTGRLLKDMHALGARLAEAGFVAPTEAGKAGFVPGMSADAAKLELKRLQKDSAFIGRLNAGDREARLMWEQLNGAAAR